MTDDFTGEGRMKSMIETPQEALRKIYGNSIEIQAMRSVAGGDINEAYLVVLSDGTCVFMKKHRGFGSKFFEAEADGLNAIRQTHTISVPEVMAVGEDPSDGKAYLLMEYVSPTARKKDFWETFGHQLALMHTAPTDHLTPRGVYGFATDDYIGASEQENTPEDRWISFYREHRLEVQYLRARHYLDSRDREAMQYILDHLDKWLVEPSHPSLLHGDLWNGNYLLGRNGYAWLIDPAVYVGHAEADLAMTELFGGFIPTFYDAYKEIDPLQAGYADRRDLYNLYHLLNHLNLFGSAYLSSVCGILRRYGGKS